MTRLPLPQALTALPGGAPLPHPYFQFLQWENENKESFPALRNAFSGIPIRVSLASKRSLGEPAGTTTLTESAGLAATSTQTSADRLTVYQTQSRDRSHGAASLAWEHGCLAVLTDLVSSQRALPAHSTALLQQ